MASPRSNNARHHGKKNNSDIYNRSVTLSFLFPEHNFKVFFINRQTHKYQQSFSNESAMDPSALTADYPIIPLFV